MDDMEEELVRILLMGMMMHRLLPGSSSLDAKTVVPKLRELADAIITEAKRV